MMKLFEKIVEIISSVVTVAGIVFICYYMGDIVEEVTPHAEKLILEKKVSKDISKEFLNKSGGWYETIKRWVETAHVTVKVERMSLRECKVTSMDGPKSTMYMEVLVYWKGYIESGHTIVGIDINLQSETTKIKILETTALVSIEP